MRVAKRIASDPEALKAHYRQQYAKYKDRFRASNDRWIETHPRQYLLLQAKNRAKLKGREFAIVESDLEWPEVCPVRGVTLRYSKRGEGHHTAAASIDRIDNSIGYVPGNVRVISFGANASKGTKAA